MMLQKFQVLLNLTLNVQIRQLQLQLEAEVDAEVDTRNQNQFPLPCPTGVAAFLQIPGRFWAQSAFRQGASFTWSVVRTRVQWWGAEAFGNPSSQWR